MLDKRFRNRVKTLILREINFDDFVMPSKFASLIIMIFSFPLSLLNRIFDRNVPLPAKCFVKLTHICLQWFLVIEFPP